MHCVRRADISAFETEGTKITPKIARIAITTNISISVNPRRLIRDEPENKIEALDCSMSPLYTHQTILQNQYFYSEGVDESNLMRIK
ncbi:MAG: hypothetical protein JJU05_12400 [Verrucomicrobia bacterium]|nr:hypothetical protein [Verrucomicrobiota bacterium]MCH8528353.1 hypothetical protein [Kiritimatiellia bacterium]